KTNFGELPALFAATVKHLAAKGLPNTILLYDVGDAPEWAHATIKPSESPDRMVVRAFETKGRDAIAGAIVRVKARLPVEPLKKKLAVTTKENTPLRNIFKQMAELPLREFNVGTVEDKGGMLFFLYSKEMVAGFRTELTKAVIQ